MSLETATAARSVALTRGETLLVLRRFGAAATGSAEVLPETHAALREAGVSLGEVELFAVAAGPGSFTGLRSGLATVKAFAHTLGRPVCAVPTLHAVAHAAGPHPRIIAVLPAGRSELFAQELEVTRDGCVRDRGAATHIAPDELLRRAAEAADDMLWAGAGVGPFFDLLRERASSLGIKHYEKVDEEAERAGWSLAPPQDALAAHVAALAQMAWREGRCTAADEVRAFYVRPSDAELNERRA